jgi:hypothetical protein
MLAVWAPEAVGLNVTVIVQLPPAVKVLQVLVSLKYAESGPAIATARKLALALPVLLRVRVWDELVVPIAWLAKLSALEEKARAGAAPVPDSAALTVGAETQLPPGLSVTQMLAVRAPEAVGVNVTVIAQLPPAAKLLQVLVSLKSAELVPATATTRKLALTLPVLLKVRVWDELVVPTAWFAKLSALGERARAGAAAMPTRLTAWGLPGALSEILSVAAW